MEALLLVLYTSALVGMSLYGLKNPEHLPPYRLVAYFAMIHVAVWAVVGVFDRIVQWRHQALRRKGYLKFYRNMRNVRRVPFIAVSIANSAVLLMVSLLYFYHVHEHTSFHGSFYPVYFLYIVVGLELLFVLPCLIYYIGQLHDGAPRLSGKTHAASSVLYIVFSLWWAAPTFSAFSFGIINKEDM
jgi:hypothetical protein